MQDVHVQKQYKEIKEEQLILNGQKQIQKYMKQHQQLRKQISEQKKKAHEAFLQVIQIQQLHEQEMQLLRQQHKQLDNYQLSKIKILQDKKEQLEKQLKQYDRNIKRHACDYKADLDIENIDYITCSDSQHSRLDDSSIMQFNDLLNEEKIQQLKNQFIKELKRIEPQNMGELQNYFEKIVGVLRQLKEQNQTSNTKYEDSQTNYHSLIIVYEALQKEAKFMADHIRKISNQKFKSQRRIGELQRINKNLQEKLLKLRIQLSPECMTERNGRHKLVDKQNTNENITGLKSLKFLLEDLNSDQISITSSQRFEQKIINPKKNKVSLELLESSKFRKKSCCLENK